MKKNLFDFDDINKIGLQVVRRLDMSSADRDTTTMMGSDEKLDEDKFLADC